MHVYKDIAEFIGVDFLRRLEQASPIKIREILTDSRAVLNEPSASKDEKGGCLQPSGLDRATIRSGFRPAPSLYHDIDGSIERITACFNELIGELRVERTFQELREVTDKL